MDTMKILLSLLTVLAVGCDKAKDAVVQSANDPGLMRTWEGPCATKSLAGLSKKTFIRFTGAAFAKVETYYTDDKCVNAAAEATYGGSFKVIEENTPPTAAKKINFTYEKAQVVATNEKGKTALEGINLCGAESFPIGKAVDLTNQSRGALCPLQDAPAVSFEAFKVEGDKLYLAKIGKILDRAATESDRATTLDTDYPYTPSDRSI
jgi:hypothetical protein